MKAAAAGFALLVLLSGCFGGDDPKDEQASTNTNAQGGDAIDAGNDTTAPVNVDLWSPNETERVLFDGSLEAVECTTAPEGEAAQTAGTTAYGCVRVPWPEGALVLPGSATMKIDTDVTGALQRGSYFVMLTTMNRNTPEKARLDPATEPVKTWEIPLLARDWDAFDAAASHTVLEVWAQNDAATVSTLDGAVKVTVTVVRDPAWEPEPFVDEWNATAGVHEFAGPNAILLHNETLSWAHGTGAATGAATLAPLANGIPARTESFVFGLRWETIEGCGAPPALTCHVYADFEFGGALRGAFHVDASRTSGPNHRIFVWPSPLPAVWTDASDEGTGTRWGPFLLYHCESPTGSPTCGPPPAEATVALTVRAEAWRGEVDLDAFRARLGVA